MKVKVFFHGILSEWMGAEEASMELPDEASLRDLCQAIRARFKDTMPEQLWDQERGFFPPQVLITKSGKRMEDPRARLFPEDELHLFLLLAGG